MCAASNIPISPYRRTHAHTFSHIRHRFLVTKKGLGLKKSELKALYKSAGVYVSMRVCTNKHACANQHQKNICANILVTILQICLHMDPSHCICM
jgi:hypothetical protein